MMTRLRAGIRQLVPMVVGAVVLQLVCSIRAPARADSSPDELLRQIDALTVVELDQLVTALEQRYGVSASATDVRVTTAAPAAPEKTTFDLWLVSAGPDKLATQRQLSSVFTMVPREASQLVDQAPVVVKQGLDKAGAETLRFNLECARRTGAVMEVR